MESNHQSILLITGAIGITAFQVPYTKLTDTKARLQQYIESIDYAIEHYHRVNHIIFCENTGYIYNYAELQEKAKQNGKTLEVIRFPGNYQAIEAKGKGYGEGEIVKYALKESETLRNSRFFYKLTGRILVSNMDRVMDSSQSENNFIFLSYLEPRSQKGRARTLLYKVNTSLYKSTLIDAHLDVDDHKHYYLEHAFFERLKDIPIPSFGVYPVHIGIQASTGKMYLSKTKLIKYRLYNRLNFFSNLELTSFQRMVLRIIRSFRFIVFQS